MIIPDCDETFNYWEPLNLLLRGFGKQTWEYSPEFAIRSYAYLLPYYLTTYPLLFASKLLDIEVPAYYYFYFIRLLLTGFTIYSELKLYNSLKLNVNKRIANSYLFLSTISTGMAHAGVELLPSSFAMQCMTLSLSYALYPFKSSNAVTSLSWIMVGGLLGWPFALVLAVPYGIYILLTELRNTLPVVLGCLVNLASILVAVVTIDSIFYKRLVLIPLNIVLYNVFGGEGEGPEIFGVEDSSYYLMNLLLNFNVIAVLGYAAIIMNLFKYRNIWLKVNGPLIIWSTIFFSQPHKEERFLYPVYSLILVNSAVSLDVFYGLLVSITRDLKMFKKISKLGYLLIHFVVAVLCISRTANLVNNYSAPLTVSSALNTDVSDKEIVNVCIGREWYHFPNSFFLPDNYRLRFVKSGFDGLLPRDFNEGENLFDVTSFVPNDMNNKNQFVDSTIIPFNECDYYIDNDGKTNGFEPDVINNSQEQWEIISCEQLINPDGHHGFGRLLFVPEQLRNIIPYDVQYMDFCLLKHV